MVEPFWPPAALDGFGPLRCSCAPGLQTWHARLLRVAWVLLLLTACPGVQAQKPGKHKVQVQDRAVAADMVSKGARLIADYGSFLLYETESDEVRTAPGVEYRDRYNLLLLNAGVLDTSRPEVQALRQPVGAFQGKRLHLVQFAGPVRNGWREALLSFGVRWVCYVPENACLVLGDSPALARLQSWAAVTPQVQWEGAYEDKAKIHPQARPMDSQGNPRAAPIDEYAVQLVEEPEANAETLRLLDAVKLAPRRRIEHILNYLNVVQRISPGDLERIAARPDIISVQPYFERRKLCERQDQLIAGNISGNGPSGPGYLAWLAGRGFTQEQFENSGFTVDISDSGVDNGTLSPNHPGLHATGAAEAGSRVAYARLQGVPNPGSILSGCDGHGTLNAHIVGGYSALSVFPHVDSSGYHYGLGVCPFVKLGSSVIFDPDNFTYPDYRNLQSEAYESGARVSNNSWGSGAGWYDIDAQEFDLLVRDAQPEGASRSASGNQEMVIVFAAGNSGPGAGTVATPGTAKNVLTVGASENVQVYGGSDASGVSDASADNLNDLAGFSSRGPCADGRHKPDLVAPGTHVSGGVPQAAIVAPNGTADACYNGSSISGGPGGIFYPGGQQFYSASSGTSHSAPAVSGACALLRQWFLNRFQAPPSPAMTKAFLLNSTRYLTGSGANDSLWSDSQGMGELNLGLAFDETPRVLRDQLVSDLFTASGQARTFSVVVADTNKPVRVTVAWTDAPGSTVGHSYNNNLDLVVTLGGLTYKGNVFNGAYSTTGGSADAVNNVESVFLPTGAAGSLSVKVTAANINSDAVPGNSIPMDQDFALVVYNAILASMPDIESGESVLLQESCLPANQAVDPGEWVSMSFALRNAGSADAADLWATLLPGSGIANPGPPVEYGPVLAGGPAVSRSVSFMACGNCGDTLRPTFLLQDGPVNLGTVSFSVPLGVPVSMTNFHETFDLVLRPNLPPGWSTASSGSGVGWVGSTVAQDSIPNAAFAGEPSNIGLSELVSPPVWVKGGMARLTFRNRFNTEAGPAPAIGYDGGVLESKVGASPFQDILSAGGTFVVGGYTRTLDPTGDNPLAGRQAWSGNSGDFETTVVQLPASAAGQSVQLKWRFGTDTGNYYGGSGWYIDNVSVQETAYSCCSSAADLAVSQVACPTPAALGLPISYTVAITNRGPSGAAGLVLTDVFPPGSAFISASPGCAYLGTGVVFSVAVLPSGASTNLEVVLKPAQAEPLTNSAHIHALTPDPDADNNASTSITAVNGPPRLLMEKADGLRVPSVAGLLYSLEYKNSLSDTQWLTAGPPVLGNGSTISLADTNPVSASRFYRVRCE